MLLAHHVAAPRAPSDRPALLLLLHGIGADEKDLLPLGAGADEPGHAGDGGQRLAGERQLARSQGQLPWLRRVRSSCGVGSHLPAGPCGAHFAGGAPGGVGRKA